MSPDMAKTPRIIPVPKTPKRAFNTHRRPSALLLNQIAHLEWAARPASSRKPKQLRVKRVRTEGEAAKRVAYLTQLVMAGKLLPGQMPEYPRAATPSKPARNRSSKTRTRPIAAKAPRRVARPRKTGKRK
jgi:hypothetical protein